MSIVKKNVSILFILFSCLVSGCGRESLKEKGVNTSPEPPVYRDTNDIIFPEYYPKEPVISQIAEHIFEVSISVGSPAVYVFFIDTENGEVSETFFNSLLVGERYIAYMEDGKLILRDIFHEDQLYMTIARDFTETADPMSAIIAMELWDERTIMLRYYKGEDYEETSEMITIGEEEIDEPEQTPAASRSDEFAGNPYFYDQEEISLQAKAKYFDAPLSLVEKTVYIRMDRLQTYEGGSVYKFTVDMDKEGDAYYQYECWLDQYFYVTKDRIYVVTSAAYIQDRAFNFENNDDIIMTIYDMDGKLVGRGTIVCQEDEMTEDGELVYRSITKAGNQVTYYAYLTKVNGEVGWSLYYTWQAGKGLISCGFRHGPGEGYDLILDEIEEITVAG